LFLVLLAVIISARATTLSILWLAVFLASLLFVVAAVLGVIFRSSRCWGVAVGLITVDLLLAAIAALRNRLGYAH
jgi:hypothetical protein